MGGALRRVLDQEEHGSTNNNKKLKVAIRSCLYGNYLTACSDNTKTVKLQHTGYDPYRLPPNSYWVIDRGALSSRETRWTTIQSYAYGYGTHLISTSTRESETREPVLTSLAQQLNNPQVISRWAVRVNLSCSYMISSVGDYRMKLSFIKADPSGNVFLVRHYDVPLGKVEFHWLVIPISYCEPIVAQPEPKIQSHNLDADNKDSSPNDHKVTSPSNNDNNTSSTPQNCQNFVTIYSGPIYGYPPGPNSVTPYPPQCNSGRNINGSGTQYNGDTRVRFEHGTQNYHLDFK